MSSDLSVCVFLMVIFDMPVILFCFSFFSLFLMKGSGLVFVSPVKQKRDICIAFPVSPLLSSMA